MKAAFFALRLVLGLALGLVLTTAAMAQPLQQVSVGRVERLANFASAHVDARHVDVWLPANYSSDKRYAVLYMHDGNMLFDASTTWNKQAWDVHLSVQRLVAAGRVPDTIVVGVWNNPGFRHSEYFPEKFLQWVPEPTRQEFISKALNGKARADAYLRFLVQELKPAIDKKYATKPGPESTFIAGSSMGGLISVYAMNEYPQVFGGAAGLSTHWLGIGQHNAVFPLAAFNYLQANLASPQGHRIYQDHGTLELDALYTPYQNIVNQIVRDKGYVTEGRNANAMLRVAEGTGHNEKAWAARLDEVLAFLLGRPN
jgi:predicted alpha/beta superfamily hydrolase